jgi:3-phenylpropionate/trans-cinnamate dioxygenase ferredoxin component
VRTGVRDAAHRGPRASVRAGVRARLERLCDDPPVATKLIDVDALGATQVAVVDGTPVGALAVGISDGEPFAVSNRCRHLFAPLGQGHITDEGCLECPWHGARYDVHTGKMVRGPQGVFRPIAGAVKATTGARALKTYPVQQRDGAIWLVD